ncbi:MAG: hypothetical protein ACUVWP_01085 [bacterium]
MAYDPADGCIWVAGPNTTNAIIFGKFDPKTKTMKQNWQQVQNQYWVFDIGYKYTYSGKDCLVMLDQNSPRIRLKDPANGADMGTLTDAFSGGYDEGIEGDYKNNWGVTLYCTNYSFTQVMKWNGTNWVSFATCGNPAMGSCYGWGHVFVIHTSPLYRIYVFKASDGSKVEEIPLNNWGTTYIVGLARGRDNYSGTADTVYTACFYPSNVIKEIDIGNYNQTGIETTSVGNIKSMFH